MKHLLMETNGVVDVACKSNPVAVQPNNSQVEDIDSCDCPGCLRVMAVTYKSMHDNCRDALGSAWDRIGKIRELTGRLTSDLPPIPISGSAATDRSQAG